VLAEILYPQHATGATIHDEVNPFVDEQDIIERCFWGFEEKGKVPNNCDKDA
jgi:hypothetical protein